MRQKKVALLSSASFLKGQVVKGFNILLGQEILEFVISS